jgi:branched-chain amino acid transport system permease protein
MGAYTCAWFASVQFAKHNVHFGDVGVSSTTPGIHISIWLLVLIAGLLTAFIGILIGLPTLRLRGDYLAIVTLGFGEILPQVANNGDDLAGVNLTNGPNGITPIDSPGFFGISFQTGSGTFFSGPRLYFWFVLLLVAITVFCSLRLRDSRLGRAWIAIREDETAAAAMGVPLMRTKTWAYATGAFFGGVAGAYFASFKSSTFPNDFNFNISAFILSMVILGGMGNVWGVMFGAAFLAYLNQEGLANIGHELNQTFGTHLEVPLYQFGIYGAIIVLVMLIRPEGLIPSARRRAEFHEGVHDTPLYDARHDTA